MDNSEIKVKKGTTTLGLICKDGLVIAAEKRATIGNLIADKHAEKIVFITDKMALTTAGTVSDPDHDADLGTECVGRTQLLGQRIDHGRVDAEAVLSGENLARELEDDAAVVRLHSPAVSPSR